MARRAIVSVPESRLVHSDDQDLVCRAIGLILEPLLRNEQEVIRGLDSLVCLASERRPSAVRTLGICTSPPLLALRLEVSALPAVVALSAMLEALRDHGRVPLHAFASLSPSVLLQNPRDDASAGQLLLVRPIERLDKRVPLVREGGQQCDSKFIITDNLFSGGRVDTIHVLAHLSDVVGDIAARGTLRTKELATRQHLGLDPTRLKGPLERIPSLLRCGCTTNVDKLGISHAKSDVGEREQVFALPLRQLGLISGLGVLVGFLVGCNRSTRRTTDVLEAPGLREDVLDLDLPGRPVGRTLKGIDSERRGHATGGFGRVGSSGHYGSLWGNKERNRRTVVEANTVVYKASIDELDNERYE